MKRLDNKRAFTLIEVVVVIVIIGILATVSLRSLGTVYESAKVEETKSEMEEIGHAIAGMSDLSNNKIRSDFGYIGDVGAFPPNLDALYQNPGSYSTWNGPYLRSDFEQATNEYKNDAWGAAYSYAADVEITSTGSGSNIVHKIGNNSNEFLLNSVSGSILDSDNIPPGSAFADSVIVEITTPNGSGGLTTSVMNPDEGGFFVFNSIPIGNHDIDIIFVPSSDTLSRFVSVLPGSTPNAVYRLDSAYFSSTGGGSGISEILRPESPGYINDLLTSGCTNNWECVDETAADYNSTYVLGSGNNFLTDLYSLEDHTTGSGTIDSMTVFINCVGGLPGKKAHTSIRTSGSQYDGTDVNLTSVTTYTIYSTTYVNNPATSSPWTWTEIDNLEAGVSIRRNAHCTQTWVQVFYTP